MKPPEPLLSSISRVDELTTARSGSPSPLKSPAAVPTTVSDADTVAEKSPAPSLAMIWAADVRGRQRQVLDVGLPLGVGRLERLGPLLAGGDQDRAVGRELRELLQAADAPAGPERVAGLVDDVDAALRRCVVIDDLVFPAAEVLGHGHRVRVDAGGQLGGVDLERDIVGLAVGQAVGGVVGRRGRPGSRRRG